MGHNLEYLRAVGFILGMPHRLLWAQPGGKMTAGLLTRAWEACGINRPAERAYVTVVTIMAGGWLSAAIAQGPAIKPLPAIAGIGTLVLGVPWWAHRRRRAKVRIERTVQAWPSMADNMGLPGSRIASATGDAWGFTARIILRKGTTAVQAINQAPAIESALGTKPGSARITADPARADRAILRVIENDPHAAPAPWPGQPETTISKPVNLGLTEDGRVITARILRRNVLIGGTTGSGKSGLLNVILAFLAACGDVTAWGIDLKGGMELQPWAHCLDKLATTPAEATALFGDAIAELDRRAVMMTARGARTWEPSPGMPALVTVVDEYAEMPADALEAADSLARRGRAVAVNLIAATQRPTQEAMGGNAVRSQMDTRVCLRVRERRDTDLILGHGAQASGWHAHTLTLPGTFLLSDPEHTTPERARGYLITDDQVTAHAARHTRPDRQQTPDQDRPAWPWTAPGLPLGRQPGTAVALSGDSGQGGLLAALAGAGPDGATIAELTAATGMTRPTLYRHLQALARAGQAEQATRGTWRVTAGGDPL